MPIQLLIYAEIHYQEVTRVIVQLISVSQSLLKEEASYYCKVIMIQVQLVNV